MTIWIHETAEVTRTKHDEQGDMEKDMNRERGRVDKRETGYSQTGCQGQESETGTRKLNKGTRNRDQTG